MTNQSSTSAFDQPVVWRPTPGAYERSRLAAFQKKVGCSTREEMIERARKDPDWFWAAVLDDLGVVFRTPPECVYRVSADPTRPVWCPGGRMNITESCLDLWVQRGCGNNVAVIAESEDGQKTRWTYSELLDQVERASSHLQTGGVRPGQVVAIMMTMTPDLVAAFLAVVRCGAIALPLFSGFGPGAIAARLQESGARFAILDAVSSRRGKEVPMLDSFQAALTQHLPLECVWVRGKDLPPGKHPQLQGPASGTNQEAPRWESWPSPFQALEPKRNEKESSSAHMAVVDAEAPALLIFTSGTTGRPKGAVHTHCGFPIKAAQDMQHSMDLGPGDIMHWVTDIGWMMGPWAIFGSLLNGVTLALYDGAPDFPDLGRLWRYIDEHRISFLGLSPTLARLYMQAPDGKPHPDQVRHLKAVGSTGSPWDNASWDWVFRNVLDSNKPIINYSGGTEISGGILSGNVYSPLKPCAFSGPIIGMDAAVLFQGKPAGLGETGELVIRNHWIGMTRGFWKNDPRYSSTYWQQNPGVWTHGDRCFVDRDGLWYLVGRSDDTIKIAGKRLGPAEVETIVAHDKRIRESAAIGVPESTKGECLVVFCVPEDHRFTENRLEGNALCQDVKERIARELGKPLAPQAVILTRSLPKTRNAKTIHRMCKAVYLNEDPGDTSSLEQPAALADLREACCHFNGERVKLV